MKALLIPLKAPEAAKTRLAAFLCAEERRRLAWAMFQDVSRAVAAAHKPDRVVIVTSFPPAIEHAHGQKWDVLIEESQISESASVDWASAVLAGRGFDAVMRLPADLPLVQGKDIDDLLSVDLESPGALLVPSRDGTGTNAIIRTPPTLFPSSFGPNSLQLHKQAAARIGIDLMIIENPRVALDIDEPGDLELFLENGRGTETFETLVETRVFDKLGVSRRES